MALTPKQQRFVDEYLADPHLNATAAYHRAGYKGKRGRSAENAASQLLGNIGVKAAIVAALDKRSADTQITAAKVLERYWLIASADPNELVEFRRHCCRCCWGRGNLYQRTDREFERDHAHFLASARKAAKTKAAKDVTPSKPADDAEAADDSAKTFDEQGGPGYDQRQPPNPNCQACFGEGVGYAFPKDTRKLSPAALALYAGVKTTKEGLEVKMHDQHAALTNVARHLGMFVEKREVSGPDGKPIQNEHVVAVAVAAVDRIDQLAAAFVGVARRTGEGGPPGDGPGEPVRPAGG